LAYEAERQRAKLVVAVAPFLLWEEAKAELKEVETKENAPRALILRWLPLTNRPGQIMEAMRTRSALCYRWTLQNGQTI